MVSNVGTRTPTSPVAYPSSQPAVQGHPHTPEASASQPTPRKGMVSSKVP